MKRKGIRDFFYNKNDFLLVVAIIVVAGFLIWWRMEVIMDYPQTLAKETGTTDTTTDEATSTDADKSKPSDSKDTSTDSKPKDTDKQTTAKDSIWTDNKLTKETTLTVSSGSATAAVQTLVSAGLFSSYDDFSKVCAAVGSKAENIKATTYTFPVGSTREDIAKKVTQ